MSRLGPWPAAPAPPLSTAGNAGLAGTGSPAPFAMADGADGQAPQAPAAPSSTCTTFASQLRPFPNPVDGKIATAPFLEGAKDVVALVDQFGKTFAPVRYDMNGNIQKLTQKLNEDAARFEYLNDMLLCEQAQGGLRATDALLWLRRALEFLHSFLLCIVQDTKANMRGEDLTEYVQRSYRQTLQRYHGFLAQRLFSVLSKFVPSRSKLLRSLVAGAEVSEEIILEDLERFLGNLNSNLTVLAKFYADFKLNPPESKGS